MITIIRYLLVVCIPLTLLYGFSCIKELSWLQKSIPENFIFEKYDVSGGDNTETTAYIYGIGNIKGKYPKRVCIGYYRAYKAIYYDSTLVNLQEKDIINIWFDKESGHSWFRKKGQDRNTYIHEFIREKVIYFSIYWILVIIFEYYFRKEWKKK